ncbi:unnamed protein product [Sphagnum balticum]
MMLALANTRRKRKREKTAKSESAVDAASVNSVLTGFVFCISGRLTHNRRAVDFLVTRNGGRVVRAFSVAVTHVIANSLKTEATKSAVAAAIPIVKLEWIEAAIREGAVVVDADLYLYQPASDRTRVTLLGLFASPFLSAMLQHAYSQLMPHSRPLPADVFNFIARTRLIPRDTLRVARYVTKSPPAFITTLPGLLNALNPSGHAVTIDNIIFFNIDPEDNWNWWLHELMHVRQYQRYGGIYGFAQQYASRWEELEAEARERERVDGVDEQDNPILMLDPVMDRLDTDTA